MDNSLECRFWSKVDRCDPENCWEWVAAKDRAGYGAIKGEVGVNSQMKMLSEYVIGIVPVCVTNSN